MKEHGTKEKIGAVTLDYEFYSGEDLYSDGDAVENEILRIVQSETEDNYPKHFDSWPVLYHLSRQRENIALPMAFTPHAQVLEIGAGMGAVTGAFARMAGSVDCIELSRRRSLVNAWRHKNCDNIRIVVGNFKDIKLEQQYDAATLVGVLEYAKSYVGGEDPYHEMLRKIAAQLKTDGKLYIAIENKLGMKYFAGYHEDHLGRPFAGIEGYESCDHVRTFTKSELSALLEESGYTDLVYYYPFPDYKLPSVIYSEDTITDADIEFSELTNYDLDMMYLFSQNRAFAGLKGTKEREIFANSFLVEARRK